jgi:prevent-host-death family protein
MENPARTHLHHHPHRIPAVAHPATTGRPGSGSSWRCSWNRATSLWRAVPETVGVRLYRAGMTFTCPVPQASSHLAELVDRARRSHERVVLTEHGQPAAVLISVDELDELQRFQDDSDIALCEAINARDEPGVPHDEFMASLHLKP